MAKNDREPDGQNRRNILRMLAASGLGLGAVSSNVTAKEDDDLTLAKDTSGDESRKDDDLMLAEGTSDYVSENEETPDWFTIQGDGEWKVHDAEKTPGDLSLLGHGSCGGDSLNLGGTTSIKGIDFQFQIHHCAGTCDWDLEVEALEQSYTTGHNDNCNGEEELNLSVGFLQVDVEITAYQDSFREAVDYWEIDAEATWYDPRSGWKSTSRSVRIDSPL